MSEHPISRTSTVGIRCECGSSRSLVIDSRRVKGGRRRRRRCQNCGVRYTSYEYTEAHFAEIDKLLKELRKKMPR